MFTTDLIDTTMTVATVSHTSEDALRTRTNPTSGDASSLESMAAADGDDADDDSVAAAVDCGWTSIGEVASRGDPARVLNAAPAGEDHAISDYGDALDRDLSMGSRIVVMRQPAAIEAARRGRSTSGSGRLTAP